MRKVLIVFVGLLLSGCNLGATPTLVFPSPTVDLSILTVTSPTRSPSSAETPSAAASAAATLPADPFAANFVQPAMPSDCAIVTPQQTEGPFYKPGSPARQVLLEPEMQGEKLIVAGYVLDQSCQPVPGALLDFWQADANGVYDNAAYLLRGHQQADEQGRYFLETVVPGLYTGRTEHIHVKIQAPGGQVITTQLYFPNVAANKSDGIFDPALLVTLEEREGLYVAYYNFVVSR